MVAQPTYASARVASSQRFSRSLPCPICDGWQGHGCWGFYSEDGRYAYCVASVFAGALDLHPRAQAYKHLLAGACRCGVEHGGALDLSDLYERIPEAREAPKRSHHLKPPTAIYDKYDNPNVRKLRYGSGHGKYFVWQRADGQGDWVNGLDGQTPGLYNGAALATADPFQPVHVTEGEGDAEKVVTAGGVAVSPSGGADSWEEEYSERLRGFLVIVCGDQDENGKGQTHAQRVAESVASQGAAVRLVFFGEYHDVGDYLNAGHSLDELHALAAHASIIAARMASGQNGSFTSQDEYSKNTAPDGSTDAPPDACPNCQEWQDRARLAETSLANLRRERAEENRYLALPNETLSAPAKLAAIALRRELSDKPHSERDDNGRPRIYRAAIAQRLGVGEAAAGANLQKVAALGLFERREQRSREDTKTFYAPGPHYHQPETVTPPERANGWGGKRARACPSCGSEDLETRIVCRDCGTVIERSDTNRSVDEPIDDAVADTPDACERSDTRQCVSSASTMVSNLAPHIASPHESPTHGSVTDDSRADLLSLAQALGWPRIPLDPQGVTHVGPGADIWRRFVAVARVDQLCAALDALPAVECADMIDRVAVEARAI